MGKQGLRHPQATVTLEVDSCFHWAWDRLLLGTVTLVLGLDMQYSTGPGGWCPL